MKILAIEDFRVGNRILDPLRHGHQFGQNTIRIPKYVVFNAEHISMM